MEKPYRPDYRPDYEKWKKIFDMECDKGWNWAILIAIVIDFVIFYYFDVSLIYVLLFHFLIMLIFAIFKINFHNYIDWKYEAEKEVDERFQADLDRYNHWLQSQDEIYDVETRRKLRRDKAMREQSDEASLRFYRQMAEEQNIQNELVLSLLERAEQAEKIGDKFTLNSCLKDLDREFPL